MEQIKKYAKRIMVTLQILLVVICMTSCYEIQELIHYLNKENYITGEAVVKGLGYDYEREVLSFWLTEIDDIYSDDIFIVEGKSVSIIMENEVYHEKVNPGATITFTSTAGFFGDGYAMPIVELIVDGEEILSFEEGYKNLIATYF